MNGIIVMNRDRRIIPIRLVPCNEERGFTYNKIYPDLYPITELELQREHTKLPLFDCRLSENKPPVLLGEIKSLDKRKPPFAIIGVGLPTASKAKGGFVLNDINSLSHSKWRCQYHIVFAPKYRRQEIYGKLKADIGSILRKLCEQKGVEIIEAEACPDHIHMLVSIPPNLSVAQFMGYLKGKSTLMIFDRHANLKYKYGSRHFWCRGYYVDTVGRNKKAIAEYIKNQLQEDIANDQISLKEYMDPFTGSKNK
jgi:putative transposase